MLHTSKGERNMKAILISDHAKWCALMMNGIKKIEVRKENVGKTVQKLIDEQGFADIYVYCTKSTLKVSGKYGYKKELVVNGNVVNGKVVFKFRCYKAEEIKPKVKLGLLNTYNTYETETLVIDPLLEKSCLSFEELDL